MRAGTQVGVARAVTECPVRQFYSGFFSRFERMTLSPRLRSQGVLFNTQFQITGTLAVRRYASTRVRESGSFSTLISLASQVVEV